MLGARAEAMAGLGAEANRDPSGGELYGEAIRRTMEITTFCLDQGARMNLAAAKAASGSSKLSWRKSRRRSELRHLRNAEQSLQTARRNAENLSYINFRHSVDFYLVSLSDSSYVIRTNRTDADNRIRKWGFVIAVTSLCLALMNRISACTDGQSMYFDPKRTKKRDSQAFLEWREEPIGDLLHLQQPRWGALEHVKLEESEHVRFDHGETIGHAEGSRSTSRQVDPPRVLPASPSQGSDAEPRTVNTPLIILNWNRFGERDQIVVLPEGWREVARITEARARDLHLVTTATSHIWRDGVLRESPGDRPQPRPSGITGARLAASRAIPIMPN